MIKQQRMSKMHKKDPNPDGNQFTTREHVNVTRRIEEGKTTPFKNKIEALAFARQKRSYVYDLFVGKKQYGFAVPN